MIFLFYLPSETALFFFSPLLTEARRFDLIPKGYLFLFNLFTNVQVSFPPSARNALLGWLTLLRLPLFPRDEKVVSPS